jgi:hypothetical protein
MLLALSVRTIAYVTAFSFVKRDPGHVLRVDVSQASEQPPPCHWAEATPTTR